MNLYRVTFLASLLWCGAAQAAPQSNDFAYGITVELEGENPLWEVTLPDDLYSGVTRADLGDIRVFDSSGRIVPHTLRRPRVPQGTTPEPVALPIFPLTRTRESEGPGRAFRIITDDAGTVIDVVTEQAEAAEQTVGAYLLDTSQLEQVPSKLQLSWQSDGGSGFITAVNVQASDDLSRWHTLASGRTLADLESAGHALLHNEIALPPHRARYLRIVWPENIQQVRLSGVTAIFTVRTEEQPRQWRQLEGQRDAEEAKRFYFDAEGYWPADRLRLQLGEGNRVLYGELASRTSPEQRWQHRYRGLFYHLEHEGGVMESEAITITGSRDRHWRLQLQQSEALPDDTTPQLSLGWVPDVLTFIAEGQGPYTIAYGSATVGPPGQPVDALLRTLGDEESSLVKQARITKRIILGGEARLAPPPPPLPWKRWLLWAILIAGVAILAWMVKRLFQQLPPSDSTADKG